MKWMLLGSRFGLRASRSKSREGRLLPLTGPLEELISRRYRQRGQHGESPLPFVFTRVFGGKRTPARIVPVGDFRKTWKKARKAAGCAGALIHDLRRTVVRNLIRAGVSERVAMQITGHKTRAVFQRYDITSDRDLVQACERLAAHTKILLPVGLEGQVRGRSTRRAAFILGVNVFSNNGGLSRGSGPCGRHHLALNADGITEEPSPGARVRIRRHDGKLVSRLGQPQF